MNAQNLLALTAATLLTIAGVAAIHSNTIVSPISEINGAKVVNLETITVSPSAAERRAAALLTDASVAGIGASVGRGVEAGLLSTQLSMPYYSFGSQFGRITKE
ncbi:hypothetical protein [Dyella sp.]|uniref:hypothetical protein n=1 Tax=Dyella sp. TaxID=1869338 RepID=UPI002ED421C8